MAYKRNVEIFEEAFEKKDAKSVVSYVARDGRRRYIAGNKNPDGGGTPMPSGGGMTEVTWQELKDKRDNSQLTPGSLYRITDYNCTTTQENTQSANHQFDIVLLALSEDKLAEEGWAMEHPTDVYDVTFSDGVTKKCYLYDEENSESYNLVDVETLLGASFNLDGAVEAGVINIDRQDKTIVISPEVGFTVDIVAEENISYNYFQNSQLEAWKVWYCLDNDKSRFAWADDSVDEGSPASIMSIISDTTYIRNLQNDTEYENVQYYAWEDTENHIVYTTSETPQIGDSIYGEGKGGVIEDLDMTVSQFTPAHEGTGLPLGRGVIYRLIDEFMNDVGYDFKNIMYQLPLTDGIYDADNGTDTWVYTFSDTYEGEMRDLTMYNGYDEEQDVMIYVCVDNKLTSLRTTELPNNIIYANDLDVQSGLFSGGVSVSEINICGANNKIIGDPYSIEAKGLINSTLINVTASTFGYECFGLELSDVDSLNYGNSGVELATKDDLE